MATKITAGLLANALAYIPANGPRDEWARVGMAIKSEYPDDTGLQLFSDWSASGGGDFDAASIRSTWRSIKAGGGVGVSTLLYLAKQNGFQLPRQGQQTARPAIDAQRLAQERKQRHEEEQAQTQARHEAAAAQAVALWGGASQEGRSAYLERKGVGGFGVRYGADGWLLVPLVDGAGRLWNVQRIAPSAPANGGPSKLFLKGGRKSGLWHVLGHLPGAAVVLVAEGYATAASLHQATGWPVVVAFDAGNLLHVAQAVRSLLPAALLAVAGQLEAVLFSQVQQGRDTHPAPGFDTSPSRADRSRIKIASATSTPVAEQLKAPFVWVFAFNPHPHPRPFIAGPVRGDVGQSVGQQLHRDFRYHRYPLINHRPQAVGGQRLKIGREHSRVPWIGHS